MLYSKQQRDKQAANSAQTAPPPPKPVKWSVRNPVTGAEQDYDSPEAAQKEARRLARLYASKGVSPSLAPRYTELEPYRKPDGSYDVIKYLQDNPGGESKLAAIGFDSGVVAKAVLSGTAYTTLAPFKKDDGYDLADFLQANPGGKQVLVDAGFDAASIDRAIKVVGARSKLTDYRKSDNTYDVSRYLQDYAKSPSPAKLQVLVEAGYDAADIQRLGAAYIALKGYLKDDGSYDLDKYLGEYAKSPSAAKLQVLKDAGYDADKIGVIAAAFLKLADYQKGGGSLDIPKYLSDYAKSPSQDKLQVLLDAGYDADTVTKMSNAYVALKEYTRADGSIDVNRYIRDYARTHRPYFPDTPEGNAAVRIWQKRFTEADVKAIPALAFLVDAGYDALSLGKTLYNIYRPSAGQQGPPPTYLLIGPEGDIVFVGADQVADYTGRGYTSDVPDDVRARYQSQLSGQTGGILFVVPGSNQLFRDLDGVYQQLTPTGWKDATPPTQYLVNPADNQITAFISGTPDVAQRIEAGWRSATQAEVTEATGIGLAQANLQYLVNPATGQVQSFVSGGKLAREAIEAGWMTPVNQTRLPDGSWVSNTDLDGVRSQSPELYEILTTKGYDEYQQRAQELEREAAGTISTKEPAFQFGVPVGDEELFQQTMAPYEAEGGYDLVAALDGGVDAGLLGKWFGSAAYDAVMSIQDKKAEGVRLLREGKEQQETAIQAVQTQAQFERDNVQLATGEWVPRASEKDAEGNIVRVGYEDMTKGDQNLLNELGVQEFNRVAGESAVVVAADAERFQRENVRLSTGEWVPRKGTKEAPGFEDLSPDDQAALNELGTSEFTAFQEREASKSAASASLFAISNTPIAGGQYVSNTELAAIRGQSPKLADALVAEGYDATFGKLDSLKESDPEAYFAELQKYKMVPVDAKFAGVDAVTGEISYLPADTEVVDTGEKRWENIRTGKLLTDSEYRALGSSADADNYRLTRESAIQRLQRLPSDIKGGSIVAAELLVPGVYTVRNWDTMNAGEKAFSLGLDALSVIPFAMAATRGARLVGTAGRAARLSSVAKAVGREAVGQLVAPVNILIHPVGTVKATLKEVRSLAENIAHPMKLAEAVVTTSDGTVRLRASDIANDAERMAARDLLVEAAGRGERPIVIIGNQKFELARSPLMRETGGLAHATPDIELLEGARVQAKAGMPAKEQGWFLSHEPAPRFTRSSAFGKGSIPVPVTASGKVADIGKYRPAELVYLDKQPVRTLNFADAKNIPANIAGDILAYAKQKNAVLYGSLNEWLKIEKAVQPNDFDLVFRSADKAIKDIIAIAKRGGYEARAVPHGVEIRKGGEWVKLGDVVSMAEHRKMLPLPMATRRIGGVRVETLGKQYIGQSFGAVASDAKAAIRAAKLEKAAKSVKSMIKQAGISQKKPGIFIVSPETAGKTKPSGKLFHNAAEMERTLSVGEQIPKARQKLFTRLGPQGQRVELFLETPLKRRQIAKLKAEGLIEWVKSIGKEPIRISSVIKAEAGVKRGLSAQKAKSLSNVVKESGNVDAADDLLRAVRAERAARSSVLSLRDAVAGRAVLRGLGRIGSGGARTAVARIGELAESVGRVAPVTISRRPLITGSRDTSVVPSRTVDTEDELRAAADRVAADRVTGARTTERRTGDRVPARSTDRVGRAIDGVDTRGVRRVDAGSRSPVIRAETPLVTPGRVTRIEARPEPLRISPPDRLLPPRAGGLTPRIDERPPRITTPPTRVAPPRTVTRPPERPPTGRPPVRPSASQPPERPPVRPPDGRPPRIPPPPDVDNPPLRLGGKKGSVVGSGPVPAGSIAWRQGAWWKYLPPPWNQEKPISTRQAPAGAIPRGRTPAETIQVIGKPESRVPQTASIDLGIADVYISDYGRHIEFAGKGEDTDVGLSLDDTTIGMSVPAASRVRQSKRTKSKKRQPARRYTQNPDMQFGVSSVRTPTARAI